MLLHISGEVTAADWLGPRLRRFGSAVAAVVPGGFGAYVRILHPAHARGGELLRWDAVAERSGRCMHRLAQFHAVARSRACASPQPTWDGVEPSEGNLPPEQLRILCAILAAHTSAPASCWFCLWEGYGWLHGGSALAHVFGSDASWNAGINKLVNLGLPPEALRGPRVRLPNRNYFLLQGPLDAATELGWTVGDAFFPQSPNLFWPQDHAWCVASEIDLRCTLVAASELLAEDIVADSGLEAWRVDSEDSIAFDGDQINL